VFKKFFFNWHRRSEDTVYGLFNKRHLHPSAQSMSGTRKTKKSQSVFLQMLPVLEGRDWMGLISQITKALIGPTIIGMKTGQIMRYSLPVFFFVTKKEQVSLIGLAFTCRLSDVCYERRLPLLISPQILGALSLHRKTRKNCDLLSPRKWVQGAPLASSISKREM